MIGPRSAERALRSIITIIGDFFIAWGCLALGVFIRRNVDFEFTRSVLPPENFLLDPPNVLIFTASFVLALGVTGFYTQRISRRHRPILAAALALQVAFVAVASTAMIRPLPRTILLLVPIFEAVAIPLWRRLLRKVFRARPRETIVIGDSADLTRFIDAVVAAEEYVRISGLVGPTPPTYEGVPYLGCLENEETQKKIRDAQQVIFVSHDEHPAIRLRLLSIRGPAGFFLLPSQADSLLMTTNFGWLGDQPLLEIAARASFGIGKFMKRAFDIVIGGLLTIIALPLCASIAAAIWLEDRRPVLLRQSRAGRRGTQFMMWKFRTMRWTGDADGRDSMRLAQDRDTRVTRVGLWLRRHRLDELPQLFNVLRGEMSLVGPRPERPEIAADIVRDLPEFDLRLLVQPGIAGLAQVSAEYDTRAVVKLRYDLTYICAWSLWLDIRILVQAMTTMMSGRGV